MTADPRKARDLELLDAFDAFRGEEFSGSVWRVAREGRDPILGSASNSRWCNGTFDVLYTSLERHGALAEIYALLSLQPIFPSKITSFIHRLMVRSSSTLRLADLVTLERLGVDVGRYSERTYGRTQQIADAAYFLGFDGLIVPSARWACLNAVLFTDRIPPSNIELAETEPDAVDWPAWRQDIRW